MPLPPGRATWFTGAVAHMRNALALAALVALGPAVQAKPWNGIEPGTSRRDEVVKKFGEPSKVVKNDARETLAYLGSKAIKGTTQAQFKLDANGVVERIDVFPGPVIDRDMVESNYGRACPTSGPAPKDSCYVKKMTGDNFKMYFVYVKLGLAVFFKEDGKTVSSLVFTSMAPASPKPAASSER